LGPETHIRLPRTLQSRLFFRRFGLQLHSLVRVRVRVGVRGGDDCTNHVLEPVKGFVPAAGVPAGALMLGELAPYTRGVLSANVWVRGCVKGCVQGHWVALLPRITWVHKLASWPIAAGLGLGLGAGDGKVGEGTDDGCGCGCGCVV